MRNPNEQPTKDPISRFFSIASFLGLVATAVVLIAFYRAVSINAIIEVGEQSNTVVAAAVLQPLEGQLLDYLDKVNHVSGEDRNVSRVPMELEEQIKKSIAETNIARIKIFNRNGVVVWSSKEIQIGQDQGLNPGFISAANGFAASELIYHDRFNYFDQESEEDNLIQTYLPIHGGYAHPIGVLEIYTGVEPLVKNIETTSLLSITGISAILLLLYVFLLLVIKRLQKIINRQTETITERNRQLESLSARMLSSEERDKKQTAVRLHEGLAQDLSAIKMGLEQAISQLDKNNKKQTNNAFNRLLPILQETITQVRSMAMDLRPSSLDDIGLIPTIHWVGREFESKHPDALVKTEIQISESQVPQDIKSVLFRTIRDVLQAIGEQAQSNRIWIQIAKPARDIELTISDDIGTVGSVESPLEHSELVEISISSALDRVLVSGGQYSIKRNKPGETDYRFVWST